MSRLVPVLALTFLLAGCQLFGMGKDRADVPQGGPVLGDAVTVTPLDSPASVPSSGPAAAPAAPKPAENPIAAKPAETPPAKPPARPSETQAEAGAEAAPAEPPPPPKSAAQLACEAKGGKWGKAGATVAMTCFQPTRDAGESCRRESDCSTLCLARSRTCAPVTPLFGCHPVLQDDGREVTLCTD